MKNFRIVICALVLVGLLVGCSRGTNESRFDWNTHDASNPSNIQSESFAEESVYSQNDLVYIETKWLNPNGDSDEFYTLPNKIVYSGSEIIFKLELINHSKFSATRTMFLNTNGHIQPIKIDGQEKDSLSIHLESGEKRELTLAFTPMYAPFDKDGIITIYTVNQAAQTEELTQLLKNNQGDFAGSYYMQISFSAQNIRIRSDSSENERQLDVFSNVYGEDSPIELDLKQSNSYRGITFGEKSLQNELPLSLVVNWNTAESLYAQAQMPNDENYRAFVLINGQLIPAFGGQYFADYPQTKNVVRNIEIDSSALPNEGSHLITGVIVYTDQIEQNPMEATDYFKIHLLDIQESNK